MSNKNLYMCFFYIIKEGKKMEKYQILKDLVGFNTIKDKENHQIINYLEGYLKERGFKTEYKDKSLIMSIGKNPKIGFLLGTRKMHIPVPYFALGDVVRICIEQNYLHEGLGQFQCEIEYWSF